MNHTIRRFVIYLGVTFQYLYSRGVKAESLGALYDGSSFTAQYGHFGFTFEILAKSEALAIDRLDVNMEAVTEDMKVFTKAGVLGTVTEIGDNGGYGHAIPDFEAGNTGWSLAQIFSDVVGQGKNVITPLPAFDAPIVIPANSKMAFYVAMEYTSGNKMFYGYPPYGTAPNAVYSSNTDMDILAGYIVNGNAYNRLYWDENSPRFWSGIIYYQIAGTNQPSWAPSSGLSVSAEPSTMPSVIPSNQPSYLPSYLPSLSGQPSMQPSGITEEPTSEPSQVPSAKPSLMPSYGPSSEPPVSRKPSSTPSYGPSIQLSSQPSSQNSDRPSIAPSMQHSSQPSSQPSVGSSSSPSLQPTTQPSSELSGQPSSEPTRVHSHSPSTAEISMAPSDEPSGVSSLHPSMSPSSSVPSMSPSGQPTFSQGPSLMVSFARS